MIQNLNQIEKFNQERHQFLEQKINKFEIAFILFKNEYMSKNNEEQVTSETNSSDNKDRVQKIEEFINQTKNLLVQEDSLALQTMASIQQLLEYMETMLASLKKLYQVKHQINQGNDKERKGKRFTKKANLILFQWLCRHYEYPYPSLEKQISLAQKCQLTFKQVQSWFINSRGKIIQKTYNEKKFKNIVKEKFFSQIQN